MGSPAAAQGIDCSKPSATPIGRTVCANAGLKAADEQLTQALDERLGLAPLEERESLQREDAAWRAQRDATCVDAAKASSCLALYEKRSIDIAEATRKAEQRLAAIVGDIPKAPEKVAAALKRHDGPVPGAWLVYLYHTGAAPVPDKEAEVRRLVDGAIASSLKKDPYLVEEIKNLGDVAVAPTGTMLLYLRHVLSTTEMEVPCFLFTKHGQPAFEAFGPFWGNTRDTTPELCKAPRSIYDLPEWRKIAELIDPAIEPALEERGSIRHGYERQFEVDALQASLVPSTLLEAPHSNEARKMADARTKAVAAFRNWRDFDVWPEAKHKTAQAALPGAIAATAKVYREKFGLSPNIAEQAAKAASDRFIASRFALLMPDD